MNTETEEVAIQVVIADNQEVARIGTRRVLDQAAGIEIVAEADKGKDALRLVRGRTPDVLVTEIDLPDLSGAQLAVRLASAPVRLLAFTAFEGKQYVRHLLTTIIGTRSTRSCSGGTTRTTGTSLSWSGTSMTVVTPLHGPFPSRTEKAIPTERSQSPPLTMTIRWAAFL